MQSVDDLLQQQDGVIARWQALSHGFAEPALRRLLRRREWVRLLPGVYVNHTGEPTWRQHAWAAVLAAWPAALCGVSALRVVEGPGMGDDGDDRPIHVAVDRNRGRRPPTGVRLHRMVHLREKTVWSASPPRIRYEHAVLDVAGAARTDLAAIGVVADAVRSRRTTARRLLAALDDRARAPRGAWLRTVLQDLDTGVSSVLEHGYLVQVERQHGLPPAQRQRRASSTLGVVYRDAAYDDLLVELDGRLFHDTAAQRDRDLDRDLDATVDGHTSIRLGYGQVFERPCATAARIATLLRQRGWTGIPTPCGPRCPLRVTQLSPGGSQPTHKGRGG